MYKRLKKEREKERKKQKIRLKRNKLLFEIQRLKDS